MQTFTTLGTPENIGLIPRAVEQLFTSATQLEASQGWSFQMKVHSTPVLIPYILGTVTSGSAGSTLQR